MSSPPHPVDYILETAKSQNLDATSRAFAQFLDSQDKLAPLRNQFCIPSVRDVCTTNATGDEQCIYLCGNSLGLMPVQTRQLVNEELDIWSSLGVEGHFIHKHGRPWFSVEQHVVEKSARIVGAKPIEVAVMGTLTANLHHMMISFYTPTSTRYKIIIEGKAFPSDHYAVESQIRMHGKDPKDALICVHPREGELYLRTSDILEKIREAGDSLALVMFSGVQYYTGQFFDMEQITQAGHAVGANVGFDLAHAVGNVHLELHKWNIDFAVWCSYKYMNAGPGGIAGLFVHEKHSLDTDRPRFSGWWGHQKETRFLMGTEFEPIPGACGYQLSNPSVLNAVCLLGSLNVFEQTTSLERQEKSRLLTAYLEYLLRPFTETPSCITLATPSEPSERGCQLSLIFSKGGVKDIFVGLMAKGVVCDEREPDCIRVAPTPLYNTFDDVWRFVDSLKEVMNV